MKKIWIAIAVALVVGAGCFWGGMSYGQSRATQDRERLMRERFGGQFPAEGTPFPLERGGGMAQREGGMTQPGGGTRGTIEAIEGQTLVISSDEGIVKVQTSETTLMEKLMAVALDDLEVGEMVIVMGSRNEDGTITARSIQSVRAFEPAQPSEGE